MARPASTSIIALDLVRFGCALLVLSYHVGASYWLSPSGHGAILLAGHAAPGAGSAVSRVGWVGVEIFFVISGLVIARSATASDWRDFLRRRVLRLAPAAWACATITLAVLFASGCFGPGIVIEWLRSILFWPIGSQIDDVYWTLGVEVFFYLAVAAAIGRSGTAARIETLAWGLGLASGLGWIAAWIVPSAIMPVMSDAGATLLQLPFGVFFALGMMMSLPPRHLLDMRRLSLLMLLLAAAAIEIDAHAQGRRAAMAASVSSPLAIAIFLAAVAVLACPSLWQRPLVRWISPPLARRIGLMTYPLYLIHQDAGAVMIVPLINAGIDRGMAELATAAAMIALAWGISAWPEPMLRRLLAAAFRPRRGRAPDIRPTAFPSGG